MNEKLYLQTASILRGDYHLPLELSRFLDWLNNQFQVKAINVDFGTAGYHQGIEIVLEKIVDNIKMYSSNNFHQPISAWYYQNILPIHNHPSLKEHGTMVTPQNNQVPGVGLSYSSFESKVCARAFKKATHAFDALAAKYTELLWKVRDMGDYVILFYFTDKQSAESDANGTTDRILAELLTPLKPFDEFNLLTSYSLTHSYCVRADSKENYDNNFGGQDWMYFK